jgi:hypothetical protein
MSAPEESDDRDVEPKTPDPAPKDEPQGDPAPSDAGAPQTLSILFIAAAAALVALLAVIGLIAFAAMSRAPLDPPQMLL